MEGRTELNLAVIGVGRIGRLHAENIATYRMGARVGAVADVDPQAAERVARRLDIPVAVADYRALLDDPAYGAVVICSPSDTHAEIIQEAAEAGKHIFCEKPIGYDLAKIDRALAAVDRAGVKLQIGFNRRFDANFRRVRQMVAEGEVGETHLLRITSRDPEPPPLSYVHASGGIFMDMTIHDFDMARYLMGSEVTEIFVAGAVLVDPEIGMAGDVDTAVTVLRFENGALGTIDNSRRAVYGYDQRVEVFGSRGMVSADNMTPDTHRHFDSQGVHEALPLYFFLERYTESYITEMREFIECIQKDARPPVTGQDGRVPVVMAMAAKRSLDEKRPVRLSEVEA